MQQIWTWWLEYGKATTELIGIGLLLNLPFGYLRAGTRKMSVLWFLYIHIPIPFLFMLRHLLGLGPWAIPFSLTTAVAGQLCGGNLRTVYLRSGKDTTTGEQA